MRKLVPTILLALLIVGCGPGQVTDSAPPPTLSGKDTSAGEAAPTPIPDATSGPAAPKDPSAPNDAPASAATPTGGGAGIILFTQACPSDDGGTTPQNILSTDPDGMNLISLTDIQDRSINLGFPEWSPDGSRIAYFREMLDDQGALISSEMYIMNRDGSGAQLISPVARSAGSSSGLHDIEPAWSPDGSMLAFSSNRHMLPDYGGWQIFLLNLASSEVTQLTSGEGSSRHPSWSPDGKRLTFISDRDGDWEVYVMNADGSQVTRLTDNEAQDRFPAWSPDGSRIVFHSDRDGNYELYVINLDTLEETRLTSNPATDATASWSPDGKWVAFHADRDGDYEIYILNVETGETGQLTSDNCLDYAPAWSP